MTKITPSRKVEERKAETNTSETPITRPPRTAPWTRPMPPSTAAMKDLMPGMIPMNTLIWG